MALITKAPRGTADVLPQESCQWQYVENTAREVAELFGFTEIRFPTFEHTELFERGVGDTTDVVQKEMYTFADKGGRSVTLRPEGTASAARLVVEHSLYGGTMPLKLYYIVPCFRYEKPQAGRLREFHQFGLELLGAPSPAADADVIAMADLLFRRLGLTGIRLEINSIGCPECRKAYLAVLKDYFKANTDSLCRTCLERLEKNPMRIIDCKDETCKTITQNAPLAVDHLCGECRGHFNGVKSRLDALGTAYTVNGRIVRGLDYYTKTVFEFISDNIGAQGTVCGGGRYDGLIAELGGPALPGLGFAMGIERILMLMKNTGAAIPEPRGCDLYIGSIGDAASIAAQTIAGRLRGLGFIAECDTVGRSVKAQMKYADKLGASYTVILGDDEISKGSAVLKQMKTGETKEIALTEIEKWIKDCLL